MTLAERILMKKWLFYADTPLQVFHSALIAQNNSKHGCCLADLIICKQFENSKGIGEKLTSKNIFGKVMYCSQITSLNEIRVVQLAAYLGRPSFLKRGLTEDNLLCNEYDVLAMACATVSNSALFVDLKHANKNLEVVYYDDGTGSYNGEVFRNATYLGDLPCGVTEASARAKLYRAIFANLPFVRNKYSPAAIYLRCPSLVQYAPSFKCLQIESSSDSVQELQDCFDSDGSEKLPDSAVVFFDIARGMNEAGDAEEIIDQTLLKCANSGLNCYLRNHPRSIEKSRHDNLAKDYSRGLWELLCEKNNLDKVVLVGLASTAQLSPVIETKQYPYLVFLYKVCFSKEEPKYFRFEQAEKMAKALYGDYSCSRVFSPSTLDEAVDVIRKCANNHSQS